MAMSSNEFNDLVKKIRCSDNFLYDGIPEISLFFEEDFYNFPHIGSISDINKKKAVHKILGRYFVAGFAESFQTPPLAVYPHPPSFYVISGLEREEGDESFSFDKAGMRIYDSRCSGFFKGISNVNNRTYAGICFNLKNDIVEQVFVYNDFFLSSRHISPAPGAVVLISEYTESMIDPFTAALVYPVWPNAI